MIIIQLVGGNGNQMFQYTAGLILAKKHNCLLLVDIYHLLDKSRRYYRHQNRDYALEMFNVSAKVATPSEISEFTLPRIGNKYMYHLKKRFSIEKNVFHEDQINGVDELTKLPADTYLKGFWEKSGYVDFISKELRTEFVFKNELPASCQNIRGKITSGNSVCIIFRRGDFVNHPYLDIVGLDFYFSALKMLLEKVSNPELFIFSDDINWCRTNFKPEGITYTYVDQALTGPLAEYYLHLISLCKHFIIPNSTFAWWGAWLSLNPSKLIIAPAKWHKFQTETKNEILPNSWITI
jgi:hypothetical protein